MLFKYIFNSLFCVCTQNSSKLDNTIYVYIYIYIINYYGNIALYVNLIILLVKMAIITQISVHKDQIKKEYSLCTGDCRQLIFFFFI